MNARPAQRGAALLTALLIVVLVTTLASAMLWRQSRSIQIGAAERGRSQADWVLVGALDWARLILREDSRANGKDPVDHLGEVWAVPLAEARLSSFLSTDENHSADSAPEAFLSGRIDDAQARYNLRNLIAEAQPGAARELATAVRLFTSVGLSASLAQEVRSGLIKAATKSGQGATPLMPERLEQLEWLGLSKDQIDRLATVAVILPAVTPVNVNTASRDVLAALFEGVDQSTADRIVRARATKPFRSLEEIKKYLPETAAAAATQDRISWITSYFYVEGQLRLDDRVIAQRSLVKREGATGTSLTVESRQRMQRLSASTASSS